MQEWTCHSSSCPLCSSSSINQLQLKGINDVLNFANSLFDPKSGTVDNTSNPHPDVVRVDDSDSDLELPPVIFPRSTSSSINCEYYAISPHVHSSFKLYYHLFSHFFHYEYNQMPCSFFSFKATLYNL